jgi:ribonuclease P/MRP protein subunit RPP1
VPTKSVLRRITVQLSDLRQLHDLALLADVMAQCDLVALQPTDERTLRGACCDSDCVDLVALDLTQRLPFAFKFSTLSVALARDIFFEIDVAPLLSPTADAHTRGNVLAQAVSLVRVTKGRNIVLTCSASTRAELRLASDIINVARHRPHRRAGARVDDARGGALRAPRTLSRHDAQFRRHGDSRAHAGRRRGVWRRRRRL